MFTELPFLGVGLGYRSEIDRQIRSHQGPIDWLEVISEHFLARPREHTDHALRLRASFPLIPHGVEMSIGTEGALDRNYVANLAKFVSAIEAPWFSDHLCFTKAGGVALGQLTPLSRTRALAAQVARKSQQVQADVGVPFLLENISYYIDVGGELTEAQFITEVLEHCECGMLLDLTNVFINSMNHGFNPEDFLDAVPLERVVQIHLAGGKKSGAVFMDTHSASVHGEVFQLLRDVADRTPNLKGVLIERDQDYPDDFGELLKDLDTARAIVGGKQL